MENNRYHPTYWKKYDVEEPRARIPVFDAQKKLKWLANEIQRLEGQLYGGTNNGPILQQIEDAEREFRWYQTIAPDFHVDLGPTADALRRKVMRMNQQRKKPFEGVAEMIQGARGVGDKEDRPLNP